ncbi:hypothetical protein [Rhizobium laguerreae]|uniref:hypothetical protein n=1 Tax=Rhizobium laguerreae TaxID=1076926 RepID=UPI001C907A20|nr:hypothetical protein [Rhizobium laguerreae]
MAEAKTSTTSSLLSIRHPLRKTVVGVVLALVLSMVIARAPTAYTGEIPLVGKFIPLKLNAIYIIIFGPLLAFGASIYVWAALKARRTFRETDETFFAIAFLLWFVLLAGLCLQYFIVLAPEGHCDRRPNFDFLWTNTFGDTRIVHCMSNTAEINKETPFYLRQQILQSWAIALIPLGSAWFLASAWLHIRRNRHYAA